METRTLPFHVYKAIFLSKSSVCNTSNEIMIRLLRPICTCSAYIVTLLQVSIIILKTVEVVEKYLYYVYKAKFLGKSRVCNFSNKNLIQTSVTFVHMVSLYSHFAASFYHYLENCRRSREDTYPT